MKIVSCIVLCLFITGCSATSLLAPTPFAMGKPEAGTPEFNLGWEHGCQTGLSTMTPSYYKSFYTYKQEPSMIHNLDYYKAWKDSYTYCRQYAFKFTMWHWDVDNASLDFK